MTITKTQLGRILGFVLLIGLVLGLSYATTAFIAWELDPGQWTPLARIGSIATGILLVLGRLFAGRITVVNDADEERR